MIIDTKDLLILGISPYMFMAGIGFVCAYFCFIMLLAINGHNIRKTNIDLIISLFGLFIGAKSLGIISKIVVAMRQQEPIRIDTLMNAGIVFYGGLIGFLLTFLLLNKIRNKRIDLDVLDIIAVCIPIFHCFARIGCFLVGCCYGIENHGFLSILYRAHDLELTQRIPVQLFEAGINIAIFVILLILFNKKKFSKLLLPLYLSMYSVSRFFLEFIRGDSSRGHIGFLSVSQVISLLIMMLLIGLAIISKKRRSRLNEIFQ